MARRERFVNNARTQLTSGITAGATSMTVDDGSIFPTEGDFRVIINNELLIVTARSTNVLTVVRGVESTTGSTHNTGDDVHAILTGGALQDYQKENTWHGNTSEALRIYNLSDGAPAIVSDFTFLNQGGATAIDRDGRIVLQTPPDAGTQVRGLYQAAPTPPYSIFIAFSTVTRREDFAQVGLVFRENSSGELMGLYRHATDLIEVAKHDNATTFNSSALSSFAWQWGNSVTWMRLEDNNTDLKFHVSPNGIDWYEVFSEGRTVFMAGGPDQIGFFTNPSTANNDDILMEVYGFGEI